jgi:hypothetical protein
MLEVTEPTKHDPPKRNRRWFQFSLRMLMIVVTVLAPICAYFGWQAKIVGEQTAMLESIKAIGGGYWDVAPPEPAIGYDWKNSYEPPFIRRRLGEPRIHVILLPYGYPEAETDRVIESFPGALVGRGLL